MFRWLTSFLLALALLVSVALPGAASAWAAGESGVTALATDSERQSGGNDGDPLLPDGPGITLEAGQSLLDGPVLVQTHDRSQFADALAYPVPPAIAARLLSPHLDGPQRPPRARA